MSDLIMADISAAISSLTHMFRSVSGAPMRVSRTENKN